MAFQWWRFVHLAGVLGLVLTHGTSVMVALKLRKERDRDRIRVMLQLSGSTVIPFYVPFALLVVGGSALAIMFDYWRKQWLVLSIAILVFVTVLMLAMARPYYQRIREALQVRPSGVPRMSDEELAHRLESPTPLVIAWIGGGGLIAILWLMIFKPV